MRKLFAVVWIFLLFLPLVFGQGEIGEITEPLTRIYDLLRAVISVLGVIALTVAGAMYMFSGSNVQARESAKGMVSYAIVGLVVVWIAPVLVGYLTAP